MKICPKCNAKHDKPGKFCSRKCANSRIRTEEIKQKVSNKLKGRVSPHKGKVKSINSLLIHIDITCQYCGKEFKGHKDRKFCSRYCSGKGGIKPKGGYREGSGRSKSGYYKGIFCGSTYELVWVIYRLDHGLKVERFNTFIQNENVKYFPDFIDDNVIIEIKGYYTNRVDIKCQLAKDFNYDIVVLYKVDLQHMFNWVKQHYNYKNIIELYDDYKPQFKYICGNCNKEFYRDKESKTKLSFCCQKCVGIYNGTHRYGAVG